jgi:hypothetical protein
MLVLYRHTLDKYKFNFFRVLFRKHKIILFKMEIMTKYMKLSNIKKCVTKLTIN